MYKNKIVWLIAAAGLIARLSLAAWAGNAPQTPVTGGSDTLAYQTLAENIVHHQGMSYAGEPTALRPPLYPIFLACGQVVAGSNYRLIIRLAQLAAGILMAIFCALACRELQGSAAIAFAASLAAPTLLFFSAEILTETLAALFVAAFFYFTVADSSPLWTGAAIGLGMLDRFNLAALAVAYFAYELATRRPLGAVRRVSLAGIAALVIVAPWFARNLIVFHGQVLYSTHTGTNLLQGLLTPDGRTRPGDMDKIDAAAGWTISDIETNLPSRGDFPPEPELDKRAMKAARAQFGRVNLFTLTARKLGYFWLSLDQLLGGQSLSRRMFLLRLPGIIVYWVLLGIAFEGWRRLRQHNTDAALLFAIYPVVVTALHLPFVMSTRIRAPLIEPELAILAGLAFAKLARMTGKSPDLAAATLP